jgi:hypothetical protein
MDLATFSSQLLATVSRLAPLSVIIAVLAG